MERCEVCAGEIKTSIFKGTKVCCEICRKLRQRLYNRETAIVEVTNHFNDSRFDKAFAYISRHYFAEATNA